MKGHLPGSDGFLVTVHVTHPPDTPSSPPGKGPVESSHPSSSGTRIAQLQFVLLFFCLFLFAFLGAGDQRQGHVHAREVS